MKSLGTILNIIFVVGVVWAVVKAQKSVIWHNNHLGERKGKAEYGRISREEPNSSDAGLSEAEFVDKFVSSVPGLFRYILIGMLIIIVGFPASCAISSW